jgi:hypothetical protein
VLADAGWGEEVEVVKAIPTTAKRRGILFLLLLHYLSATGLYKFGENPSIRTKIETLILTVSITTWKINK